MGFWKKIDIKKMQQLAYAFVINHRSTFNQNVETNRKLH